jgi:hypothetical protein
LAVYTGLLPSGGVGGQVDNAENGSRSGITDEVNALAIPMIVEVTPLHGV